MSRHDELGPQELARIEAHAKRHAQREFVKMKSQERSNNPHIPKAKRKGLGIFGYIVLILFLGLVAVGGTAFWGYRQLQSIDSFVVAAQEEPYLLKEGYTLNKVVRELASSNFNEHILNIWVKLHRYDYPVIQRGEYLVDGIKTLPQILADMRDGNVVPVKFPSIAMVEGMTVNMIERRLKTREDLVHDGSLELVLDRPEKFIEQTLRKHDSDDSLITAIGGVKKSLDGLLMPATYEYIPNKTNSVAIIEASLVKMATFMRESYLYRNQKIDGIVSDPYQVLILASLVERESSLEEERPLIAGVFLNRLKKGIKLQTDPAVMYGVSPDFKGPLRLSQLRRDTPYNTYTRRGLPPTPIAMPSQASIEAVLHPADTNAYFFVARGPDPKDGHIFSSSLKEHNAAVQSYRKAVRDYKKQVALAKSKAEQEMADAAEAAAENAEAAVAELDAEVAAREQARARAEALERAAQSRRQ